MSKFIRLTTAKPDAPEDHTDCYVRVDMIIRLEREARIAPHLNPSVKDGFPEKTVVVCVGTWALVRETPAEIMALIDDWYAANPDHSANFSMRQPSEAESYG